MPNYVRWREQGAAYFFTVVTHHRRHVFDNDQARRNLREAIAQTQARWPFEMFASVLLPDHMHCIWLLPNGDDEFPKRWSHLKRRFSQAYLAQGGRELPISQDRRNHRELGVWQPRYWEHLIRDESELYAYRDYIHLNPVKHGLAKDPLAWPWSSVHRHLRLGWLDSDWSAWTPIDVAVAGE